jgi:hypothetical protein
MADVPQRKESIINHLQNESLICYHYTDVHDDAI